MYAWNLLSWYYFLKFKKSVVKKVENEIAFHEDFDRKLLK